MQHSLFPEASFLVWSQLGDVLKISVVSFRTKTRSVQMECDSINMLIRIKTVPTKHSLVDLLSCVWSSDTVIMERISGEICVLMIRRSWKRIKITVSQIRPSDID